MYLCDPPHFDYKNTSDLFPTATNKETFRSVILLLVPLLCHTVKYYRLISVSLWFPGLDHNVFSATWQRTVSLWTSVCNKDLTRSPLFVAPTVLLMIDKNSVHSVVAGRSLFSGSEGGHDRKSLRTAALGSTWGWLSAKWLHNYFKEMYVDVIFTSLGKAEV